MQTKYKSQLLDIRSLTEGISTLTTKIDTLNNNVERLIQILNPPVQQLTIESMTFEQAKESVSTYMREHRTASISELAEQLQIDLRTLCEVIEQLKEDGHVKEREQ